MMKFLKSVFKHFSSSNASQKGASLSYYAVFSLLPILIVAISVLGLFFGEQAVSGDVYKQLKDFLGDGAAKQIEHLIREHHMRHNSVLTTIIGFATLALSASGMFVQINNSLNGSWNIEAAEKNGILKYLFQHLRSISLLMVLFAIATVSAFLNSFLVHHSGQMGDSFIWLLICEHLVTFVLLTILFAAMFKFLSDAKVHSKAAVLGGMFTSLLFTFGKSGIALYIGHSHISTTFGSASALALLMLWVYYTSQIIFLGASFVKVTCDKLGHEISPQPNNTESSEK